MKPILLLSLGACILSSCSRNSWQTQNSSTSYYPTSRQVERIPTSETSESTRETLLVAYQEELLAHDLYVKMLERYPELSEVSNIVRSESEHQSSVGKLLDIRGIARPVDYGVFQPTYDALLTKLSISRNEAIEVGVMIETGDIDHLLEEYKKITDSDVRKVFERIGGASFNHLRAFVSLAKIYTYTPKTDWTKYLSETEVSQSGPLQYKMSELLEKN